MTIKVGDTLPEASFKVKTAEGTSDLTTAAIFAGKKVVLFAVPGAFTPVCSNNHLPGFVEMIDAIKAKGVDTVACVSVNDHYVLEAWAKTAGATGKILFLADGLGAFTKAIGLDVDLSGGGLGLRSKRYSMLVDNGVVASLNIEDTTGKAEVSGAARILEQL